MVRQRIDSDRKSLVVYRERNRAGLTWIEEE